MSETGCEKRAGSDVNSGSCFVDPLVGHLFENGTVWLIINHEKKVVAKAMSDTAAKEIVCERMDCEWEFAHRIGFRAVVAKEQYHITGVLSELPNGALSSEGGAK